MGNTQTINLSVNSTDGAEITVYHYTSQENANAIQKSGVIYPSKQGAFGGNKVYFTTLDPSEGKAAIARNNYDGKGSYWEGREAGGSVDVCFKLSIPASKLVKENDQVFGRDIYTHAGPVTLVDYQN